MYIDIKFIPHSQLESLNILETHPNALFLFLIRNYLSEIEGKYMDNANVQAENA